MMNYLHATPVTDGLCRKCGAQLARIGQFGYACVYCEPAMFPRPKMSAAADTAELDRLRAENKRMREVIEVMARWLGDGSWRMSSLSQVESFTAILRSTLKGTP